jgi:micrococcal nuclease
MRSRGVRSLIGSLLLAALLASALLRADDDGGSDRGGTPAAEPEGRTAEAQVTRVIDGDTIEVRISGGEDEVRYIGIDTPETVKPGAPVQCFGPQASTENHKLVDGQRVRLVFDRERRDVYGRLLAYVYTRQGFVNAQLVRGGYARTLTIPPNTAHAGLFHSLAQDAGRSGRGLWGVCS